MGPKCEVELRRSRGPEVPLALEVYGGGKKIVVVVQ
jgi:hypothetical protein